MLTALLLAFLICGTTAGEIALTRGSKSTGEPEHLRIKPILIFLGRAVCNGWFWVGIPLMALSFFSLLILLSWYPISFVIPVSALTYVVGTFGAKYVLKEEISPSRWIGVLLVCIGVALVSLG